MTLNASKVPASGGTPVDPMAAGTYPARLVQAIDLGLQEQRPYQGQEKPPAHEIMLTYEFVDEFMKDEDGNDVTDKPRWLSERFVLYSLDAEKAKSTARYNAFDPDGVHGGDFVACLNIPVNVTVTSSPGKGKNAGRVYNNIAGVAPMRPKDAKNCPELVNEPLFFDLDTSEYEDWKKLGDWVKKIIKSNLEYEGSALQEMLVDEDDDTAQDGDEEEYKNPF